MNTDIEQQIAFWREVIEGPNTIQPHQIMDPEIAEWLRTSSPEQVEHCLRLAMNQHQEQQPLIWRVLCEHCRWQRDRLDTRTEAVQLGHDHINKKHGGDEEWSFRVQGLKPNMPV